MKKYAIRFRAVGFTTELADIVRAKSMKLAIAAFQATFRPEKYVIDSVFQIKRTNTPCPLDMGWVDMAQAARS